MRTRAVDAIKRAAIPLSGTLGFKKAEVTAGGVSLDEVDSRTMQSKLQPNLYLAGEDSRSRRSDWRLQFSGSLEHGLFGWREDVRQKAGGREETGDWRLEVGGRRKENSNIFVLRPFLFLLSSSLQPPASLLSSRLPCKLSIRSARLTFEGEAAGTERFAMRVYAVDRADLAPAGDAGSIQARHRLLHDSARRARRRNCPPASFGSTCEEAKRWLDEGVLTLVSPLDSENQAEAEISEEQERWLEWMVANGVEHVRLAPLGPIGFPPALPSFQPASDFNHSQRNVMRQAGTIITRQDADRFANYLLSLGIGSKVEPAGDAWAIWIRDENQLPRSKQELEQFQQRPQDPVYQAAEQAARKVRREAAEKIRQAQKNYVDMRAEWARPMRGRPVTMVLIVASVAVTLGVFRVSHADLLFLLPEILAGQVWRLVTPIFLHAALGLESVSFVVQHVLAVRPGRHDRTPLRLISLRPVGGVHRHHVELRTVSGSRTGVWRHVWRRIRAVRICLGPQPARSDRGPVHESEHGLLDDAVVRGLRRSTSSPTSPTGPTVWAWRPGHCWAACRTCSSNCARRS